MRIRKRYQNTLPPPDLSSPLPPSTAVAAAAAAVAAPPVAPAGGTTGGKDAEAMAAEAADHVSGGGYGGWGGRGLHSNARATNRTPCPPFRPPPSAAAAAGGAERGDRPPPRPPLPTRDVFFPHGHGQEEPKREQDGENGGDTGVAHSYSGGNAPAPQSLGAKASEASAGHGGHKVVPSGDSAALAAAEAMVRWGDEEGEFPPKKRRGGYQAHGRRLGLDQEEEEEEEEKNLVAEKEMKQPRPSKTRRRRTTTMAAPAGTVLTSAGTGNGGAPTATGVGASATRNCGNMLVKEEGGDVMPAAVAALADGNHGSRNGKKRRSPAVLMEGSRCSRVNGRGWRCCQQTLVGYSLCEHHLGKGRLRSVSSVRCNNGRARKKDEVATDGAALPPPSLPRHQNQLLSAGDGEDEEEEIKLSRRRRNKIGMVKARSISSLLHQPDHYPTPATIPAPAPLRSPSTPTPSTRPVTAAAPPPYNGTDTMVA